MQEPAHEHRRIVVDHTPARLSSLVAVFAALVAALSITLASIPLGLVFGGMGVVFVALGVYTGYRAAVTAGAALAFIGVLLVGLIVGASVEVLLAGTVAIIVAWDVGENAIGIGEQVSGDARTGHAEAVHVAATLVVGVVSSGLVYGVSSAASGGKPVTSLFLLLGGTMLVGWLVRE